MFESIRESNFIQGLKETRITPSPSLLILASLIIFSFFCFQAIQKNVDRVGSMDYPPIRGGSDQVDYHVMAYTLSSLNYPGKISTPEMRAPFVEFSKRYGSDIPDGDKRLLSAYLKDFKEKKPRTTAYRPWLYPIILGIGYKIFGYSFEVGRYVNVVLYGASALIIFLSLFFMVGRWSSLIAVLIFSSVTGLANLTSFFLTAPSSGFALSLLFAALLFYARKPKSLLAPCILGFVLGLCVLSKQIFVPISVLIILMLFVWILFDPKNIKANLKTPLAALIMFGLVMGPYAAYNIATTKTTSLLTGTNGWQDMPYSYDTRIIDGENRFSVREDIFNSYAEQNNISIRGNVDRALYGRQIFLENLKAGLYKEDFWRLFKFKIGEELFAKRWEWIVRFLAVIGLFALPLRASVPSAIILIGSSIFFGLTISSGGRTLDAFWPLIAALAGTGSVFAFRNLFSHNFFFPKLLRGMSYPIESKISESIPYIGKFVRQRISLISTNKMVFVVGMIILIMVVAFVLGYLIRGYGYQKETPLNETNRANTQIPSTIRVLAFGQSNMLGAYGPPHKTFETNQRLSAWDWHSDQWVPAVLGQRPFNPIVGSSDPANNLAYVFAGTVANTCNVNVDIVLLASNGKKIEYFLPTFILEQYQWVNNETSPNFGNSLADEIMGSDGDARQALKSSGGETFDVVLIHQGEANHREINEDDGPYKEKLNSLVLELKNRDMVNQITPIIFGGINPGYVGGDAHRLAIESFRKEGFGIVEWTGIEDVGDISPQNNQHATGRGLTELGIRYFDEFMRMGGCPQEIR